MFKILLYLTFFLLIVIVSFNLAGPLVFAKVLENAIGAPVKVGDVRLDMMNASFRIQDLSVKNPQGFETKTLAVIPEIFVKVEPRAFLDKTIHITEVRLSLDEITVEKNGRGAVNLAEIGAVKNRFSGQPESQQPSEPQTQTQKGTGMKLQIDAVHLNLDTARYVDAGKTNEFPLKVQETLHNVTNPRDITRDIVIITLKKVGMSELTSRLDVYTKGLQTQLKTKLEKKGFGNLTRNFLKGTAPQAG